MISSTPLVANIVSLAVVLMTYRHSGDPRVIVFTFILLAFARLMTIEVFSGLQHFFPGTRPFLEKLVRPPVYHQKKYTVTDKGGTPTGDSGYFFFFLIVAFFAVTLMLQKQEISLEALEEEAEWSLIYFGVYLVQDMVERKTVMDFNQARVINLAYNMGPVLILHLSVLAGGILSDAAQRFFPNSPWLICGPLIAIKHLSDLHFSRRRARKLKEVVN